MGTPNDSPQEVLSLLPSFPKSLHTSEQLSAPKIVRFAIVNLHHRLEIAAIRFEGAKSIASDCDLILCRFPESPKLAN